MMYGIYGVLFLRKYAVFLLNTDAEDYGELFYF